MSEHTPKNSVNETSPTITKRRKLAIAAGATLAGAAVVVSTLLANGQADRHNAAADPVATAPAPPAETGPSPEQLVQQKLRQDAAAVVRGAGSLLRVSGGQSVYDGRQYDNYGENDGPQAGKPGIKVVENPELHNLTVQVTNASGRGLFSWQMYLAGSDRLATAGLNADTTTAGPDPANLDTLAVTSMADGVEGSLAVDVSGHVRVNPQTDHLLTSAEEHGVASVALYALQRAAEDLGAELPPDVVETLSN